MLKTGCMVGVVTTSYMGVEAPTIYVVVRVMTFYVEAGEIKAKKLTIYMGGTETTI